MYAKKSVGCQFYVFKRLKEANFSLVVHCDYPAVGIVFPLSWKINFRSLQNVLLNHY